MALFYIISDSCQRKEEKIYKTNVRFLLDYTIRVIYNKSIPHAIASTLLIKLNAVYGTLLHDSKKLCVQR